MRVCICVSGWVCESLCRPIPRPLDQTWHSVRTSESLRLLHGPPRPVLLPHLPRLLHLAHATSHPAGVSTSTHASATAWSGVTASSHTIAVVGVVVAVGHVAALVVVAHFVVEVAANAADVIDGWGLRWVRTPLEVALMAEGHANWFVVRGYVADAHRIDYLKIVYA